jgi:hypothetical protein
MMAKWTKILPFFLVEYIAKKICERFEIYGKTYAQAYRGVLIRVNPPVENGGKG